MNLDIQPQVLKNLEVDSELLFILLLNAFMIILMRLNWSTLKIPGMLRLLNMSKDKVFLKLSILEDLVHQIFTNFKMFMMLLLTW